MGGVRRFRVLGQRSVGARRQGAHRIPQRVSRRRFARLVDAGADRGGERSRPRRSWSIRWRSNWSNISARPTWPPRARRRKKKSPSRNRSARSRRTCWWRCIAASRTARCANRSARLRPRNGEKPLRAFSFLEVEGEDDAQPADAVDLVGMAEREPQMNDFWISCGHHLLDRDAGGGLIVTDEFLKVYLARPELIPPPEACAVERTLYGALLADPRMAVSRLRYRGHRRCRRARELAIADRLPRSPAAPQDAGSRLCRAGAQRRRQDAAVVRQSARAS